MASQVLSGTGNVSYTNNTGQNVRVVLNFVGYTTPGSYSSINISWAGVTVSGSNVSAIGRNLAFFVGGASLNTYFSASANNMIVIDSIPAESTNMALPTEIMLAPNQTFN